MWFGTLGGLNRWDGYEFESFSHVGDDPATLSDATVLTLHVDAQGNLWVGTAKGLDRYEPATRKFRRYGKRFRGPDGADRQKVELIASDRAGRIWFASLADSRLFRLDPRTGEESAAVVPGAARYWITALHVDRSDGLWVATQAAEANPTPGDRGYRLFVFDRCSEIGEGVLPTPRQPLLLDESGGKVWCVAEDPAGRLWFGRNGGGLLRLDPRGAGARTADVHVGPVAPTFLSAPEPSQVTVPEPAGKPAVLAGQESGGTGQTAIPSAGTNSLALAHLAAAPSDPTKLAQGIVRSLALGPAGELWVLTLPQPGTSVDRRERLHRVDPDTMVARRVTPRGEIPQAGGDAVLQCLGVDHSGVLWLGSNAGGLRSADISARDFSLYRQRADGVPGLDSSFVRAICRARDGLIWVGTPLGLNRVDRSQPGLVCSSTSSDGFVRLPHPNVQAICEDRHGNLWIGTGGGVAVVAPTSGSVEWYRADATRPGSLSDDFVQVIHEDAEGRLWFGTLGKGVDEFDPQTRRFRNHPATPDHPARLPNGTINALYSDRRGRLWVGTDGGLARLESAASGQRQFRRLAALGELRVMTIGDSSATPDVLWVGTAQDGLCRFELAGGACRFYTRRNSELPDDMVYGILTDTRRFTPPTLVSNRLASCTRAGYA